MTMQEHTFENKSYSEVTLKVPKCNLLKSIDDFGMQLQNIGLGILVWTLTVGSEIFSNQINTLITVLAFITLLTFLVLMYKMFSFFISCHDQAKAHPRGVSYFYINSQINKNLFNLISFRNFRIMLMVLFLVLSFLMDINIQILAVKYVYYFCLTVGLSIQFCVSYYIHKNKYLYQ